MTIFLQSRSKLWWLRSYITILYEYQWYQYTENDTIWKERHPIRTDVDGSVGMVTLWHKTQNRFIWGLRLRKASISFKRATSLSNWGKFCHKKQVISCNTLEIYLVTCESVVEGMFLTRQVSYKIQPGSFSAMRSDWTRDSNSQLIQKKKNPTFPTASIYSAESDDRFRLKDSWPPGSSRSIVCWWFYWSAGGQTAYCWSCQHFDTTIRHWYLRWHSR